MNGKWINNHTHFIIVIHSTENIFGYLTTAYTIQPKTSLSSLEKGDSKIMSSIFY
jgi:hypothetical protein